MTDLPDNIRVSSNPFVQHALALLRDKDCPGATFRELLNQISVFLTFEAMGELPVSMKAYSSETPTGFAYDGAVIDSSEYALIALMRSGQTMASAMHPYLPSSLIGHAGFRAIKNSDEIECFYSAIPDLTGHYCFLYDSGTISGRSLCAMIEYMVERKGADTGRMAVVTSIASLPAMERINRLYPDPLIPVYAAACDETVHDDGRIVYSKPGAGSFQERIFGSITPYDEKYEGWRSKRK